MDSTAPIFLQEKDDISREREACSARLLFDWQGGQRYAGRDRVSGAAAGAARVRPLRVVDSHRSFFRKTHVVIER